MQTYELKVRLGRGTYNEVRDEVDTDIRPIMAIATNLCNLYHVTDLVLYTVIDGFAFPLMQYNEARDRLFGF